MLFAPLQLHAQAIVHGDICTRNVLLHQPDSPSAPKRFCITDFGLAQTSGRIINPEVKCYYLPRSSKLEPAFTPAYDMYSVGVLLLAVLTWSSAETQLAIELAGLRDATRIKLRGGAAWEQHMIACLSSSAAKCLDPDPNQRPSAEGLLHSLAAELGMGARMG